MNCMNAYLSLVDHSYNIDEQIPPTDPQLALIHLLAYASAKQKLPCEIPWRLDQIVSRSIERHSGMRPTGGWRELCSLAAGARYFRATGDAFHPITTLEDVIYDTTETIRTKLLESFTVHLAPPSAAANLFLLMGIHPIWGLRLAYVSNQFDKDPSQTIRFGEHDSVFPEETLNVLQSCVYGIIACVVASLRNLDPQQSYCINALADLFNAAGQFGRRQAEAVLKQDILGLPVFLTDEIWTEEVKTQAHHRSVEIATLSYLEQIFVPACAIRRFEDGTFTVFEGAFDDIQVGNLDDNAQNKVLSQFLSDVTGHHQIA